MRSHTRKQLSEGSALRKRHRNHWVVTNGTESERERRWAESSGSCCSKSCSRT